MNSSSLIIFYTRMYVSNLSLIGSGSSLISLRGDTFLNYNADLDLDEFQSFVHGV